MLSDDPQLGFIQFVDESDKYDKRFFIAKSKFG